MKCRLTRELEVHEPTAPPELVAQCVRRGNHLFAPPGATLEHPDCHYLVSQCCAEPADDECRAKTQRTPAQLAPKTAWHAETDGFREVTIPTIEWAALRLQRGIHPDDFERYAAGEILGYTPDGEYVPGPNWKPTDVADEEDEETDGQ